MFKLDAYDPHNGARSRPAGDLCRDEIARVIEEEIVTGVLRPGGRIDERALAERFSVSRAPVRDAIARLSSVGLIAVKPRSGSYVAVMDVSTLLQLFELMCELEGLCARYAALRMDIDEQATLKRGAARCVQVAQEAPENYPKANFEFHDVIYQGAKNGHLQSLTWQARRRVASYRNHTFRLPGRLKRSTEEHLGIVAAICAGDADAAQRLMVAHTDIKRSDFAPFIAMMS